MSKHTKGSLLRGAIGKVFEGLFPTNIYCVCCGSIIDGSRKYALCDNCIEKLNWLEEKTCEKCGKILNKESHKNICNDCGETAHYFDKGYTCTQYGLYERAMIMDFKYRDKSWIGRKIGEIMAERISLENIDVDMVIPVPVHKSRMEERGYNQAEILARVVAKGLGKPMETGLIERKEETKAMKDLGRWERIENTKNAFSIVSEKKSTIEGSKILLIDDIYTTGATLDGCCKVLKNAGVERANVLTFAAGGDVPASLNQI